MAEYNPSKIIKDGNTYNFRDNTKIPLAGSNQISGSLIPATTDAYDFGSSSYQWNNAYIKSLTINGVACGDILTHNVSEFIPVAGTSALAGSIVPNTDNAYNLGDSTYGFASFYANKIYLKGSTIFNVVDDNYICVGGATAQANGANLVLNGKNRSTSTGEFKLEARDGTYTRQLIGKPDGTLSWNGDIIPSTDGVYNMGSSTNQFSAIYASGVINHSISTELSLGNANDGADIALCPKEYLNGFFRIRAYDGTTRRTLQGNTNGTLTWDNKNVAMQEDVIPRNAGSVLTSDFLGRTASTGRMVYCGGADNNGGACLLLYGKDSSSRAGEVAIQAYDGTNDKGMRLYPNGTWTWNGTACQITSDQRFKQQIAQIDDALLTAWEDVNPVQFKYNDAVKEKSDNARLHTGYVVQQIDDACKSHNVDISKYGLYCHEEYPEETEEVEVEQSDGTKTKETKVIREASEHYSLRYTEALIVECAYLRKCIKELRNEIAELSSK